MRYTQLLSGTLPGLALALMSAAPAWGQDVAQPSSAGEESPPGAGVLQEPAGFSDSPLQPVTVEHRGRLLVLTYGPKPRADGSVSFTHPRGKPPRFAVYQGQRQIASGQFEYG
jgi:hypothetical protein